VIQFNPRERESAGFELEYVQDIKIQYLKFTSIRNTFIFFCAFAKDLDIPAELYFESLPLSIFNSKNQLYAPVYQIIYFLHNTLHVSDGISVHHQEFRTVHAYVKQKRQPAC
jgi:hypothetical protein